MAPASNSKFLRVLMVAAGLALVTSAALAQEEVHYQGYSMGSNPGPVGTVTNARGLVTALYAPFLSNFTSNEYTWVVSGLVQTGSALQDSVYSTSYDVTNAQFTIWEDPCQDARTTFYACPSDIVGQDVRYSNTCGPGGYYIRGHFTQFGSTFDTHGLSYGEGTFRGFLNWDSGTHINDLPPNRHGGWTFGGTTTSQFACIPTTGDPVLGPYQQALTGRVFQAGTRVNETTWGRLRRLYHP